MGLLARFDDRLSLMSEVIARTDVLDKTKSNTNVEPDLRRAISTCMSCRRGRECQNMLRETMGTNEVPQFCPNLARFEAMIRD